MRAAIFAAMLAMASGVPAGAATFVYVSNAEDGDIGMYTLPADGSLQPGQRFKAEKLVMPMAVSPDKRFLIAAVRSKPFQAYSYGIDQELGRARPRRHRTARGELPVHRARSPRPLSPRRVLRRAPRGRESGRRGRQGRRAAAGHPDGPQCACDPHRQHEPLCVRAAPWHRPGVPVPVRREERTAHREHAAGPAAQARHGPRHLIVSPDNRFVYLLNELTAHGDHAVARSRTPGRSRSSNSVLGVCPRTPSSVPGMPRGAVGTPGANQAPRNTDNDIWASDLHLTPNGRFLYAAERTSEHARRLPRRWRKRKAHLSRKHADREAAPRFRHRPDRPLRCRLRRASRTRSLPMRSTPRAARSSRSDATRPARARTGSRSSPSIKPKTSALS